MKAKLAMLRDRARSRKVPFDLDLNWLSDFIERTGYDPYWHHIDRISFLGGYTKNNLQVLPFSENIAKGNRERRGQAQLY